MSDKINKALGELLLTLINQANNTRNIAPELLKEIRECVQCIKFKD